MKQVKFKKGDKRLVCWVDRPSELKEGYSCELKDLDGLWTVEKIYDAVDVEKAEIKRNWHVGGL